MIKKTILFTGVAVILLIGLVFMIRRAVVMASPTPENLGVSNNQLSTCPETPNCVTSRAQDAQHAIAPIPYATSTEEAHTRLLQVLNQMPRVTVVENQPNYIRAESRSPFWGFFDDNEFYFDSEVSVIEVRAAARLGSSDLDKNRQRIEEIRALFQASP
jgi:uncharacterized protein (DUF1499 family)